MKTFNHVGNDLKDLKTENIEGKRYYVLLKAISTLVLPRYSVTFQNNQLLNGEEGLVRQRPTRLVDKRVVEEPAYIISVSRISRTKREY